MKRRQKWTAGSIVPTLRFRLGIASPDFNPVRVVPEPAKLVVSRDTFYPYVPLPIFLNHPISHSTTVAQVNVNKDRLDNPRMKVVAVHAYYRVSPARKVSSKKLPHSRIVELLPML